MLRIYNMLRKRSGYLGWWPADSDFEVFVGTILTQNTSWKNVEKAIYNLKAADALSMEGIASMPVRRLERLIRPSGYYRQKAQRLKGLCSGILRDYGGLTDLFTLRKDVLRTTLLSMNGIGRETADSIILYAAHKPTFVIDAYTRRMISRLSGSPEMEYDSLKNVFESGIRPDVRLYKDFHAQIVELGKNYCTKSSPKCAECPLRDMCAHYSSNSHRVQS